MSLIPRESCRVCGGPLRDILSLGVQYVSNFVEPGQPDGVRAPLELVLCVKCHLVQLRHTVPADAMYQNYWYRSGTNRSMREALADVAEKAEELIHLAPGDTVLDIGCNDGTLLASYNTADLFKIGYDPAENLAPYSRRVTEHVVVGYFGAEAYLSDEKLATRRPKIATSIAMFYDLEDPGKFVSDVKAVMDPDGLWVVQMSYLPLMLKQNEIGNVCHEHLEYYSLRSFEYLLSLHDLRVVDVELNAVNGGSFRAYIRMCASAERSFGDATYRHLAEERLQSLRAQEASLGLDDIRTYADFARRVDRIRRDVVEYVKQQAAGGKRVYVYGASTKGNTVLQCFGLDSTLISAAADRNPEKWGKVTVGTHIPIISEEEARAAKPDFFLVLPWHFLDEFIEREKDYLSSGGRFIVPMPHFTLV